MGAPTRNIVRSNNLTQALHASPPPFGASTVHHSFPHLPTCYPPTIVESSQLAALHTAAHVTAVLSLGAGAVSFTHIVKAAEPVFTAGFSAALLGQTFAAPVYFSLLPIIAGVSLASLKELSFSWVAFGNAMGSNTASALRGIMGKKQMGKPVGENMTPANLYAVLTVLAFCFLSPVALVVEGRKAKPAWDAAMAAGATAKGLSSTILLSGLFYYLYNEVAFLALDSVNPVTVREALFARRCRCRRGHARGTSSTYTCIGRSTRLLSP